MSVSAFRRRLPDQKHFEVWRVESFLFWSLLTACTTLLCLPPSVSSTDAEEGGFPVGQAGCSPPLLPSSSSCMRSWNNETSFKCHVVEVGSRWASLLANLVNTINSNWECDWRLSWALYTQNDYKACPGKLIQRNVKKEQNITKKRTQNLENVCND